jgi:methylglutaconyl-CoA hydratase
MYQSIVTEVDEGVGILTLNKPERHNALDELMVAEITSGLVELESNPKVRVIVLSASGRNYCAGTDPAWMTRSAAQNSQESQRDEYDLARLFKTLHDISKPTVARVQGSAYNAGVGLIAACDIAVGTYDAQFALSDVKFGLLPAVVCPYLLLAMGERHARRYMLTAERFSATEAYRIGLLHEIVPGDEQLDEGLGEIIDGLLKGSPAAQNGCKALIRVIAGQPIDDATLEDTVVHGMRARNGAEGREGLAAFVSKRKPSWDLGHAGHGSPAPDSSE